MEFESTRFQLFRNEFQVRAYNEVKLILNRFQTFLSFDRGIFSSLSFKLSQAMIRDRYFRISEEDRKQIVKAHQDSQD